LANIPLAHMTGPHGMLGVIYNMGIANEFFPLLIFMGVGAMTDFGPLLATLRLLYLVGLHSWNIWVPLCWGLVHGWGFDLPKDGLGGQFSNLLGGAWMGPNHPVS